MLLSADSLKQNCIPVEIKECLLTARKPTYAHSVRSIDTHAFE
jgi:hypothetical protein